MPRHDNFIPPEPSFHIRSRGRLPHWELDRAIYSVTFRLDDAIPNYILRELATERAEAIANVSTAAERRAVDRMFDLRLDHFADEGYGACHLERPEVAEVMMNALWHAHTTRYELHAFAVMPNHVHALFVLFRGNELASVMHSIKSYTANRINALVGRTGTLWQREYWDRIVRDTRDYRATCAYIVNNPCKAGLRDWPYVWPRLEAAAPAG